MTPMNIVNHIYIFKLDIINVINKICSTYPYYCIIHSEGKYAMGV